MSRVVKHAEEPRATNTAYSFQKETLTEELDSKGRVKNRKQKLWEVSFANGHASGRLLEVNGKPASASEVKKNAENEKNAREVFSSFKAGAGGQQTFLSQDMVSRFNFRLLGQEPADGRMAYELSFEPKPRLQAHGMGDRLLNNVAGTLWIDTEEFELLKAQINLRSEVDFWGGLLGTLRKLAYTTHRTRVASGLWLNTSSTGEFEGRKLVESMHVRTTSKTVNFHTASADHERHFN